MEIAHIGVVVDDLEAAIDEHARLGFTFVTPRTLHVHKLVGADGTAEELDFRIAFSRQGPPYIELCEAAGSGLYGPEHVGGIHHVAVLADDVAAEHARMLERGAYEPAAMYGADGELFIAFAQPAEGDGPLIELIDRSNRDGILDWIERGE